MRRMNKNLLNVLVALSAIAAMTSQRLGQEFVFSILKPLTTILVISVVWFYSCKNSKNTILVFLGLIACLAGDILLLDEARFAYGLASFLLAHLVFSFVLFNLSKGELRYFPLVILLFVGAGFYYFLYPELGELAIPVAVYLCCISTMCWLGINLYLLRPSPASNLLCIAGLLFVFSDAIIAVNKFLLPFSLSQVVILTTYWLSISLIANAFTMKQLQ